MQSGGLCAYERNAVRRTDGLKMVATQTFKHPRSSTAGRLRAQAEGCHYSTFSLYALEEFSESLAAVLAACLAPKSAGLTSTF